MCDLAKGLKCARAATLMLLALPGCTYLYQCVSSFSGCISADTVYRGEELGLPEVVDLPDAARQDPTYWRNQETEAGRDGCRVPIPWTKSGVNFGFGSGASAHLPMSKWMGKYAVELEDKEADSTLNLYRKALGLRRELQGPEQLEWVEGSHKETVHFSRPGGWEVLMNLGEEAVKAPKGEVLISSGRLEGDLVPKDTTVWVRTA